jgi:uncharacterized lipoprotein YmbA
MTFRRTLLLASVGLLSGCGFGGGPAPATYVLGDAAPATDTTQPLVGRNVVYVQRVLVPDYLDTTDIQIRQTANELKASKTGRWGERLSLGVTGAFARTLARLLPGDVVTAERPLDPAWRQVLVNVETFEPRTDGSVVLVARWQVTDSGGHGALAGERVSLTAQAGGPGDAAIVAAMTGLVDQLATRVARALTQPRR